MMAQGTGSKWTRGRPAIPKVGLADPRPVSPHRHAVDGVQTGGTRRAFGYLLSAILGFKRVTFLEALPNDPWLTYLRPVCCEDRATGL